MAKVLAAFLLGLFAAVLVWAIGEAGLYEFGRCGCSVAGSTQKRDLLIVKPPSVWTSTTHG